MNAEPILPSGELGLFGDLRIDPVDFNLVVAELELSGDSSSLGSRDSDLPNGELCRRPAEDPGLSAEENLPKADVDLPALDLDMLDRGESGESDLSMGESGLPKGEFGLGTGDPGLPDSGSV